VAPKAAPSAAEQTAGPAADVGSLSLSVPAEGYVTGVWDAAEEGSPETALPGRSAQVSALAGWAGMTSLFLSEPLARYLPESENGAPPAEENAPGQAAAQRKALALGLRLLYPYMTDDEIAQAAKVSRRTLFRWDEYRRLKIALRKMSPRPRGTKDREGNLEAWTDDED
jgi:hypothetical protein